MANFCARCGQALGQGHRFCPRCGTQVSGAPGTRSASSSAVSGPSQVQQPMADAPQPGVSGPPRAPQSSSPALATPGLATQVLVGAEPLDVAAMLQAAAPASAPSRAGGIAGLSFGVLINLGGDFVATLAGGGSWAGFAVRAVTSAAAAAAGLLSRGKGPGAARVAGALALAMALVQAASVVTALWAALGNGLSAGSLPAISSAVLAVNGTQLSVRMALTALRGPAETRDPR